MVRSKSFDKKENSGSDAGSNDSSGIYVVPRELKVKLEVSEAKETVYRADIYYNKHMKVVVSQQSYVICSFFNRFGPKSDFTNGSSFSLD